MDTSLNTKRILIFLAFVIGVSWAVALAIYSSSIMKNNPIAAITLANYIIITTPALGNIFTRLVTKEGWGHLGLRLNFRRGWRFYLAAWLLPLLAVIVGGGIYYMLYPQSFDPSLNSVRTTFASVPSLAANPWLGLLVIFLQIMLVSLIINSIASIGEELGWRAYLLPKLMILFGGAGSGVFGVSAANTGARRAALLVGLVWGVWHFPLFFMSSSLTLPFALVYMLFTALASVLLSWVTLRSGSAWTASVGHGMLNGTSALPTLMLTGTGNPLLGPAPTGLVGMLGYLILALVLLFNRRAFAKQQAAGQEKVQAAAGA